MLKQSQADGDIWDELSTVAVIKETIVSVLLDGLIKTSRSPRININNWLKWENNLKLLF